ncbi:MAG: DUF1080 domain-containing protein [Phycisphaera sp.]|nr:DUF1080 domain-containing protein [Phycisphaera sp.]
MNQRIGVAVMTLLCACAALSAADDAKKDMPEPRIITPGVVSTAPPSDATVLFGGDAKDLSNWKSAAGDASPPTGWRIEDGAMVGGGGGGSIVTTREFTDVQIHLEFNLPVGDDKHRGNSGLYIQGLYEVQIIDSSSENPWHAAQQCASIYKTYTPLANVCRKPGEWQVYDVIFHGAKLDGDKIATPARITVIQNGVVVQDNRPIDHGTGGAIKNKIVGSGPLMIQDHGAAVKFRNIWVRDLPPIGEQTTPPLTDTDLETHAPHVEPATVSTNDAPGAAPSDAVMLFDGKAAKFKGTKKDVEGFPWKIENGYMEVAPGGGSIVSTEQFSDVQLHVEWASPSEVKGSSQGRGNSGVYVHGTEVQVLDSYDNVTYYDGQAGAIYKQYPPLVNACRKPGVWQTYDIIYRTPKYNDDSSLKDPGGFTVLHNGVVIQDHVINKNAKPGRKPGVIMGNLLLQDHGNPVRYRNVWYRPLN